MDAAIGMIEVEGVAAGIVAADAACKAAEVRLMGWESIGGFTTTFFSGSISDVAAALDSGETAARDIVDQVTAAPLNQPEPPCRNFVSFPVREDAEFPPGALGLVETRGYGIHRGLAPGGTGGKLRCHERDQAPRQGAADRAHSRQRPIFGRSTWLRTLRAS